MKTRGVSALLVLISGVPALSLSQSDENGRFLRAATAHIRTEYPSRADGMTSALAGRKDGVIVSVKKPKSSDIARYWIMFEEVTPVSGGVAHPDKKWKRLGCLGISGPKYGGRDYMWMRKLTDSEYDGLRQIQSRTDVPVGDEVVRDIIREKVLPEQAREWHGGSFFVRATTAFVFEFTFHVNAQKRENLRGLTLYLDTDGTIIAKHEAMMNVD